jgi:hypothetical protein
VRHSGRGAEIDVLGASHRGICEADIDIKSFTAPLHAGLMLLTASVFS